METALHPARITFPVDDVTPAVKPLPECRTHEAVRRMLDGELESCCDYHGTVVADVRFQPLLAAVYLAFSQHRPLVLSPDAVWITIAQGTAHHMAIHGERLRRRFVSHDGKLDLVVKVDDWVRGSPENPWPEAFSAWAGQIRYHVGEAVHDALVCDFSTTGPVERAVSQIVMMDTFQQYFHFVLLCVCGIPSVTLEGAPADWDRLKEKVAALRVFDIDWWLDHLLPVCEQFCRAARGDFDPAHWQGICKLRAEYGGDVINGWVCKLFPYLREFPDGPCRRRNPIFDTGKGMTTSSAPQGLSRAPFTWVDGATSDIRPMEAIGGLVGVTQDPQTLALRPRVGWAVREAEKIEVLLTRVERDHVTAPPATLSELNEYGARVGTGLPPDLARFYHRTNGARVLAAGGTPAFEIVPAAEMTPVGTSSWRRLVRLSDGSRLAINLHPRQPRSQRYDPFFCPVCLCRAGSDTNPDKNPVVALCFTELLERLLDSNGRPFWIEPGFKPHGHAGQYTWPD